MADSVEQKLSMSLDDLVRKERTKPHRPPPQQDFNNGGHGPQRHQDRQQQPMSNWPWRGQGGGQHQQQQHRPPPPNGGGAPGRQGGWRQQQQQGPPMGQNMGRGYQQQPGPVPQQGQGRGSVFARLGGPNAGGEHMQQQQYPQQHPQQGQQPYQQQQRQNAGGFNPRQQQPQHYQQQQQRQPVQPVLPRKPKLECFEEEAGHAMLYHHGYLILQVDPLGNMVLDSGDDHSPERRAAFNIALSHFNISVREAPQPPGAAPDAQRGWNVSEGHRLQRFTDGMAIPSRGPLTANRAALLLAAYGETSGEANAAAEAAQEASRKAAIAAGLLPDAAGGEAEEAEAARVRRLKAQGRFMPY